jgi:hypothetical protein
MTKIERKIYLGDEEQLKGDVRNLSCILSSFEWGTRIYISEAPNFRQVVYDLVSRGFNALGFMGVIDVVILLDPNDRETVKSVILLHGYDEMGQLSTETIWPRPEKKIPEPKPAAAQRTTEPIWPHD